MIGLIIGELKFFDILEEVNKEEQTTIETLLAWMDEVSNY